MIIRSNQCKSHLRNVVRFFILIDSTHTLYCTTTKQTKLPYVLQQNNNIIYFFC